MPRRARVTALNCAHHVCQRSFEGKVLFHTDKDRNEYLAALREEAQYYKLDILAYCLLKDRVHLIVVPRKRIGLSKTIGRTHFWYAQYLNRRRKRTGKLWHDRFHSCPIDNRYLAQAVQYVETQPITDRLVRKAEKYNFSSAQAHITNRDELDILALDVWPSTQVRKKWASVLANPLDDKTAAEIQLHTQTGRPWGGNKFIEQLEKKLNRRLHALPVGRPPKETV